MSTRPFLSQAMKIFFLVCICLSKTSAQRVVPGDFPDPSVTKVDNAYWATATTSNWAPVFPLLKSTDLVNWQTQGFVFNELPTWADYYFWAPEISYDNGKVYVYYTAHKTNGSLCVAIASAEKPQGPYKDHGPLICEEAGSIDAFPMRDENGKLYLLWKEDGNSVQKPTPIWAIEMNEDRTALIGEKKELFRNDVEWEKNLVEGVSMIRHGGYYYAFYSGAGCCGRGCSYATGVARAKNLLGPWEKDPKNPLLTSDDAWNCPGHGTAIKKDGKYYFLYHAYQKEEGVYTGRQGLIKEFTFTSDGWIEFAKQSSLSDAAVPELVQDEFDGKKLSNDWQWSVFQQLRLEIDRGKLNLYALADDYPAFVAQKIFGDDFTAYTAIMPQQNTAESGLALIGDDKHLVGISYYNGKVTVYKIDGDNRTQIIERHVDPKEKNPFYLEMKVMNGRSITFSYREKGKAATVLTDQPVDGYFLPPWDRPVKVGLTSTGRAGQKGVFENFMIRYYSGKQK
ncbi:MAG TPA: family 43 glycosylhydrolase [Ohtaekwangia sp.]|nr:family 43 glycosylhydrolase [Ohtaekwangia sp.]